jgi:hypothetical protein
MVKFGGLSAMSRLEYVLNAPDPVPGDEVSILAAELRRDLIPLGVWVVVRRPDEADAGLHGECSDELHRRIDSIVASIMSAHKAPAATH